MVVEKWDLLPFPPPLHFLFLGTVQGGWSTEIMLWYISISCDAPCFFSKTWGTRIFEAKAPVLAGVLPGKCQKPFGEPSSGLFMRLYLELCLVMGSPTGDPA